MNGLTLSHGQGLFLCGSGRMRPVMVLTPPSTRAYISTFEIPVHESKWI